MFNFFQSKNRIEICVDKKTILATIKDKNNITLQQITLKNNIEMIFSSSLISLLKEIIEQIKSSQYNNCKDVNIVFNLPAEYFIKQKNNNIISERDVMITQLLSRHNLTKNDVIISWKTENNYLTVSLAPKKFMEELVALFNSYNLNLKSFRPNNLI
ncbi:MAG: hypothetical protein C0412_17455 [Flavobacterium sp.]|nr:hypothetical protein [Flavobacterium sp.]